MLKHSLKEDFRTILILIVISSVTSLVAATSSISHNYEYVYAQVPGLLKVRLACCDDKAQAAGNIL